MAYADGEKSAGGDEETSKPMLVYRRAPVVSSSTSSHSWQCTNADDRYTIDRHQRRAAAAAGQGSSLHQAHHPHHDLVKSGKCSQHFHEIEENHNEGQKVYQLQL